MWSVSDFVHDRVEMSMILWRTAVCMAVDRLDAVLVPHNAAPTEYTTVIRNYFIFRSTEVDWTYVRLSSLENVGIFVCLGKTVM